MERGLFACACGRAIKKQFAFAGVPRQCGGMLEFRLGFGEAAELEEEVATNAGQKVIGLEGRLGSQRVNEFETCGWTKGHCDRDSTVQFHDRRGRELCQGVVKSGDAVPVRFRGVTRASVACGDGSLQSVWPEGAIKLLRALQSSETAADEESVPPRAVLIEQQDRFAARPGTRV